MSTKCDCGQVYSGTTSDCFIANGQTSFVRCERCFRLLDLTPDAATGVAEVSSSERDHWCIAALNYDKTEAMTIAVSDDVIADDLLYGESDVLQVLDKTWAKDLPPGLYRLSLKDSRELLHPPQVVGIECLVVFPPLVSTKSADEFATINRRWREIRAAEQPRSRPAPG